MQIREPEPESSQLQVVGVVTFYIVAALVVCCTPCRLLPISNQILQKMIIINKAVLNNTPDLPFTLLVCYSYCKQSNFLFDLSSFNV